MSKDLRHYNELLQEAGTKNDEARVTVAKEYVPKLYTELTNQGFEPYLARYKVEKDCSRRFNWRPETIVDALPNEAKIAAKQENGRKSAKARKAKALMTVSRWIQGNHVTYGNITEAFYASTDGKFRMGVNSQDDFLRTEPITPKSVTTEPISVKPVNSAPVKSA